MTQTAVVASSPNISGNIGQCVINSTDVSVDSWHTNTIAVNSCTGQIISQNTYYDWSFLVIPLIIIITVGIILSIWKVLFD